jgi:hypothetical protein
VPVTGEGYAARACVRLLPNDDPEAIIWPDLGYVSAHRESFAIFEQLRNGGVMPEGVRFQVPYPTPLAPGRRDVCRAGPAARRMVVCAGARRTVQSTYRHLTPTTAPSSSSDLGLTLDTCESTNCGTRTFGRAALR